MYFNRKMFCINLLVELSFLVHHFRFISDSMDFLCVCSRSHTFIYDVRLTTYRDEKETNTFIMHIIILVSVIGCRAISFENIYEYIIGFSSLNIQLLIICFLFLSVQFLIFRVTSNKWNVVGAFSIFPSQQTCFKTNETKTEGN